MTFVRLAAMAILAACSSPPTAPPAPMAPRVESSPPRDAAPGGVDATSAPAAALSDEDCKALRDAPALAVAVVTEAKSDCSSVGHRRIVLEVRKLVRGGPMAVVVTSRPLHDRKLRVGDFVVAALEPAQRTALNLLLVRMPS
jgi:hypothetical protein